MQLSEQKYDVRLSLDHVYWIITALTQSQACRHYGASRDEREEIDTLLGMFNDLDLHSDATTSLNDFTS